MNNNVYVESDDEFKLFFSDDDPDDFIKGSWERVEGSGTEVEDFSEDVIGGRNDEALLSHDINKKSEESVDSPNDQQPLITSSSSQPIERMMLNDHKAGMEGLDKEKINRIILEASKGSKYYENEKRKEQRVRERIDRMKKELQRFTDADKQKALVACDKLLSECCHGFDVSRTLVHIDMDAFYAAVEMRNDPKLKDVPMAVGGNSMLCTSNYLARKFGVRAAMPGFIARKLCPGLVIVPTHFDKYRSVSAEIRQIFTEYDPNFSPMSLDEAYLDLTDYLCVNKWKYDYATSSKCAIELIVEEIRNKIFQRTQLTASAGIAPNLMLSKICSDLNKPNGQFCIKPDKETVRKFMEELPIRKVFGIGRVTEQMLKAIGVMQCKHLLEKREILYLLFSKTSFDYFMRVALGISSNRITHEERKSMSVERTFSNEHDKEKLLSICRTLSGELARDLSKENLMTSNVTLKYKLSSFVTKTRSKSIPYPISGCNELFTFTKELLLNEIRAFQGTNNKFELRLMGVRASRFHRTRSSKQNTVESFFTSNLTKANSAVSLNINNNLMKEKDDFDNFTEQVATSSTYITDRQQESLVPSDIQVIRELTVDCPVCGSVQKNEPVSLNTHIDSCLTKQTIKDIIKEQDVIEANVRKRKLKNETSNSPAAKKKTLLSFWGNTK